MISTLRGLAILVGVAVVLALGLVLAPTKRTSVESRSLVTGLPLDQVTSLTWDVPGAPQIVITRDGNGWTWKQPFPAVADRSAVANVFAALRGVRWHRKEHISRAGQLRARLTLAGPTSTTLGIGQALAGSEQVWMTAGDAALLVDQWVATTLAPTDFVSFLVRQPFVDAAAAPKLVVGTARLEGTPRRTIEAPFLVSADLVRALEATLAELTITRLADAQAAPASSIDIDLGTVNGTLGGACGGGGVLLRASTGQGCVDHDAVERLRTAVTAFDRPSENVLEPRPAPLEVATVTLVDGTILDVTKAPLIGGAPADPVRVTELLAVLAAPAEVVPLRAIASAATPRAITITDRHGATIVLELGTDHSLRRAGEPRALRLTAQAWAALTRPASALRDSSLWSEEPTTISTITIDGITYQRGAVIGEWTRIQPGAGAVDSKALEHLAAELAAPKVIADAGSFKTMHTIKLVITPPSGRVSEHLLELGAPIARGCPVRAGASVLLARAICDDATKLAR